MKSRAWIAVYSGESPAVARLVALSSSPRIVREVAEVLLGDRNEPTDSAAREIEEGRRRALKILAGGGGE